MIRSKLGLLAVSSILLFPHAPLFSQQLNSNFARDPGQPIDQQYTDQIQKVHDGSVIPLSAGGLSSRLEDRAHTGQGSRRRFWRARHAALRRRRVQVLPPSGGEPARA